MCVQPIVINTPKLQNQPVPCGKCPKCVSTKVQQWQFRIKQQMKISQNAYFVTLTYDEDNVPYGVTSPTLCKRDVQLFLKRLRKLQSVKSDFKIKYYLVGEYGSKTKRPHYHAIMFDIFDVNDIHKAWNIGFTYSPKAEPQAVKYVLKYISKQRGKVKGKEREFSLMSKGLGANYLSNAIVKYHQNNLKNCFITDEGFKKSMPKYYKDKLYDEHTRPRVTKILQKRSELSQEAEFQALRKKYPKKSVNEVLNILEMRKFNLKFDARKKEVL